MNNEQKKNRKAVRRYHAESYILISLIAFGVTIISVRVFLQLTGFPQIGNSVLHIAHALWGALLLFIAVFLPLALANRWGIQVSAVLSGIGIGLFIDEVGKFITQTNDYFFPPALPLIYSFFLMVVLVYLLFRRSRQANPRNAMYHVLEGLKDVLDGDLDTAEAARIETQLAIARQSNRKEIVTLASAIGDYLQIEKQYLSEAEPDFWKRAAQRVDAVGQRLGRRIHHTIISLILILWVLVSVIGLIPLIWLAFGGIDVNSPLAQAIFTSSELAIFGSSFWLGVLIFIDLMLSALSLIAVASWFRGNETLGVRVAIFGALGSLVALQPLLFYLVQFAAVISTLLLFVFLLILLAYRRWYLVEDN